MIMAHPRIWTPDLTKGSWIEIILEIASHESSITCVKGDFFSHSQFHFEFAVLTNLLIICTIQIFDLLLLGKKSPVWIKVFILHEISIVGTKLPKRGFCFIFPVFSINYVNPYLSWKGCKMPVLRSVRYAIRKFFKMDFFI